MPSIASAWSSLHPKSSPQILHVLYVLAYLEYITSALSDILPTCQKILHFCSK
jgi:hypothetical protein